jgi:glycosyltransferase involved in cell wall biosynthesis
MNHGLEGEPAAQARLQAVAVVPALNEQLRVGRTVAALARAGVDSVIVVDDGSSDSTGQVASDAGAIVVRRGRTGGKGAAIIDGLARARGRGTGSARGMDMIAAGGCVVLADGDLGDSAEEMAKVMALVASGLADMAVAGFPAALGSGFGLAVGLARAGIRGLCKVELRWPLSGQRAVRADLLLGMLDAGPRSERGFGFEVGLTIDWLRAGHSLIEVPTCMTHRATGRDIAGFAHRGRQFAAVARALAARL